MTSAVPTQKYANSCICLGDIAVNGTSATLYICDDLVIARYGDGPGEAEAQHIHALNLESSAFLLAAYRLYLDTIAGTQDHDPLLEHSLINGRGIIC